MPDLPVRFAALIIASAPFFAQRSWLHTRLPLVGAILAPGRHTAASVLRLPVMTRLHLDATLHDPAPPRVLGTTGRPR